MTHLESWGLDRLGDDAVLCATELASNAILHSRTPFTLALRRWADGVRIDVQDDRPDRLPAPIPAGAVGPLESGTTGRGLRLISAVASRWGFFNTPLAKTVWVELDGNPGLGPVEPVVELAAGEAAAHGSVVVTFVDVPVRTAVASGAQVDDLVRQVQLDPDRLEQAERDRFYRLLERSATPRLIGRHEAFRAAGRGFERFTFKAALSPDQAAATRELTAFLRHMVERGVLQPVEVGSDVEVLRAWVGEEYAAQSSGSPPGRYPA